MTEPAHYSLDQVVAMFPGMTRDSIRRLVRKGRFVPRVLVGRRWFFDCERVHEFIRMNTSNAEPAQFNRSTRDLMQAAAKLVMEKSA